MTLKPGEVVLIRMQFHQAPGSKVRPAVVLLDTGDDDFIAAPITSQPARAAQDIAISNWRASGLNVASTVRVHKLAVLGKAEIARKLGTLSEADQRALTEALCKIFCNRPSH